MHKVLIGHVGCHLNILGTFDLGYVTIGKGLPLSLALNNQQDFQELH